jgi:hypothetical protein
VAKITYKIVKPGYRVGSDGSVWSCLTGVWRQLKPAIADKYGHRVVQLGRGDMRRVGPLVLSAFKGARPQGKECRHLNGNAGDDDASNLEWGTSKENQLDRFRHGTHGRGERNPMAKLTDKQVAEIRALSLTQSRIASMFGISRGYVSMIQHNKKRKEYING